MTKLYYDFSVERLKQWQNEKYWHCTSEYFDNLHDLELDEQRCHFCHFPDGKFLEIHHLDGDHSNFELENLVPICSLCHRSIHIGWAGVSNLAQLTLLSRTQGMAGYQGSDSQQIDIALHNNLQRFFLLKGEYPTGDFGNILSHPLTTAHSFLGSILSANHAPKDYIAHIAHMSTKDLSLLEFIMAFLRVHEEQEKDKAQDYKKINQMDDFLRDLTLVDGEARTAQLALAFNKNVFAPYHKRCGYTLEERIAYYESRAETNPYDIMNTISDEIVGSFEAIHAPKEQQGQLVDIDGYAIATRLPPTIDTPKAPSEPKLLTDNDKGDNKE